jgi:hypothetical protein
MLPSRYAFPKPATVKKQVSEVVHVPPPLKGLSWATKLTPGEPGTATILSNFTIEDDRIQVRAGFKKIATRGTSPVWHLIPWYSTATAMLAASNNELWNAQNGNLAKGGFTSNDWHWTSFSNLGQEDFTIMVNGSDGVWSWDGGFVQDGAQSTLIAGAISKANPAVVTVPAADIGHFTGGMDVAVSGATGDFAICNGNHVIGSVNVPPNTFTLLNINTSAATGTSNAGITVTPLGSFVHETITRNAADPWVNVSQFQIVISHQNRLWFADNTSLAVFYLPIIQKTGEVTPLPLNAIFRRGGSIRALATWTMDGGMGMDDNLVIFTTNGECAIYSGTDPDSTTDWQLVGVFRFDAPMSKHCVVNYGGDLYVLISTGLVPMSTLIRAETENLGQADRSVISIFLKEAIKYRSDFGWQTFLNPSSGRMFCNIPQGGENQYRQLIRHMPRALWSEYRYVPARCWNWIDPMVYFGDDKGNIYQMHPTFQSDDGQPILADVQMAWSQFGTPAKKKFNMIQAYFITNGDPRPVIDVKVKYDSSPPINTPDISFAVGGSDWNVSAWDTSSWISGERTVAIWNGVAARGAVGAVRVIAKIHNCSFSIAGFDVTFEAGSIL